MKFILYISTFERFLRLEVSENGKVLKKDTLHRGLGHYFGITTDDENLYVVAQNMQTKTIKLNPELPMDHIIVYDKHTLRQKGSFPSGGTTLHQIKYKDGLIWAPNCTPPQFFAIDPKTARWAGSVDIEKFIPNHIKRAQAKLTQSHPTDIYHFNSVEFDDKSVYILAHNRNVPSFILRFSYNGQQEFFAQPTIERIYQNVGHQCHVLHIKDNTIYTITSFDNKVVQIDKDTGSKRALLISNTHSLYTRGLALTETRYFVGAGIRSAQKGIRWASPSRLVTIDRNSEHILRIDKFGDFGNVYDIMLGGIIE